MAADERINQPKRLFILDSEELPIRANPMLPEHLMDLALNIRGVLHCPHRPNIPLALLAPLPLLNPWPRRE